MRSLAFMTFSFCRLKLFSATMFSNLSRSASKQVIGNSFMGQTSTFNPPFVKSQNLLYYFSLTSYVGLCMKCQKNFYLQKTKAQHQLR